MKRFLLVIAYFLIWSTPFAVAFWLWALGIVLSTDETILSLTNKNFISNYLPFIYIYLKPYTYFIFPDAFADLIWSWPVLIHTMIKTIVTTWLGFWLLTIAKRMPNRI